MTKKYLRNAVFARSRRVLVLLTLVMFSNKGQADDFTTSVSQPYAVPTQTWNDAIWEPGPFSPTAGNTYEVLAYGRISSPSSTEVQTFPGDLLILNTDARIRVRTPVGAEYGTTLNFPGVDEDAGLVLNGGRLQAADDHTFIIAGRVAVVANSFIDHCLTAGNFMIAAQIEGTGNLTLINGSDQVPLDIRSSDNAYSGTWFIRRGYLNGTGNGSLGTGNIVIASRARFAVDYDIQTPGTLTLLGSNSVMDLHQDCRFAAVSIDNTPLAPGTYTYAELAAQFPGNFAADGSGSITVDSPTDEITAGNDEAEDSSTTTLDEEATDAMNLSASADVQTVANLNQLATTMPSGVMASAISETQIRIQWNPVVTGNGLAGYRVYRNGTPIATTTATSYTDAGLSPGTPYCYAIAALDLLGSTSAVSAQACTSTRSGIDALAPSVPSGLMVFATGPTQIMILWNISTSSAGIAGYSVYRNGTLIATTTDTLYTDSGLALGIQYCYMVVAYDRTGNISSSSAQACAPIQGAPIVINAPGNLVATAVASTRIDLTWADNSNNEEGFRIERYQPATGTWVPIATVGTNATSYSDLSLTPSTTYSYRVYAFGGST